VDVIELFTGASCRNRRETDEQAYTDSRLLFSFQPPYLSWAEKILHINTIYFLYNSVCHSIRISMENIMAYRREHAKGIFLSKIGKTLLPYAVGDKTDQPLKSPKRCVNRVDKSKRRPADNNSEL